MTDRELLKLAAEAAGLTYRDDLWNESRIERADKLWEAWNPLTDDGDALRLAVRLAMVVRQEPSASAAGWSADQYGAPTADDRGPWFWKEWIRDDQDPWAATRRAIVRAAAELGKKAPAP